jgi:isochorismate synthase EntC
MTPPWQQLAEAPYAFAWREGTGPIRAGWGEAPLSEDPTGIEVRFRHFHRAAARPGPSWWQAFPAAGSLRLPLRQLDEPARRKRLSIGEGEPCPAKEGWRAYCGKIERALAEGGLKKVVPARAKKFPPLPEEAAIDLPSTLMARSAEGSFRFFLRYGDARFFGSTPELLFQKRGESLHVPAIAGTRPLTSAGTEATALELQADPKERAEHQFVVDGILASLRELGLRPVAADRPSTIVARNLVHLYTPVSCPHQGVSGSQLLAALHPTPAVGGLPRHAAAAFLAAEEPWDRGLFASPLHVIAGPDEICLVAIRSALATPEALFFFAGAGYVPGSDWEREWNETDHKMASLKGLLEEP